MRVCVTPTHTSPVCPHQSPLDHHFGNLMGWAGWRFTLRQPMRTCSRRVAMCPARFMPWQNFGNPQTAILQTENYI